MPSSKDGAKKLPKAVHAAEPGAQAELLRKGSSVSASASLGALALSASTPSKKGSAVGVAGTAKVRLLAELNVLSGVLGIASAALGSAADPVPARISGRDVDTPGCDVGAGARVAGSLALSALDGALSVRTAVAHSAGAVTAPDVTVAYKYPTFFAGPGLWSAAVSAKVQTAAKSDATAAPAAASTGRLHSASTTIRLSRAVAPRTSSAASLSEPGYASALGFSLGQSDETLVAALGLEQWMTGAVGAVGAALPAWRSVKLACKADAKGATLAPAVRAALGSEVSLGADAAWRASWDGEPWGALRDAGYPSGKVSASWLRRLPLPAATLLGRDANPPGGKGEKAARSGRRTKTKAAAAGAASSSSSSSSSRKGAIETCASAAWTTSRATVSSTAAILAPPFALALGVQSAAKLAWPRPGKTVRPRKAAPGSGGDEVALRDNPMRSAGSMQRAAARAAAPAPSSMPSLPSLGALSRAAWVTARCDLWRGHSLAATVGLPAADVSVVYRGEWKGLVPVGRPHAGSEAPPCPERGAAEPLRTSPAQDAVWLARRSGVLPGPAEPDGTLRAAESDFRLAVTAGAAVSLVTGQWDRAALSLVLDSR